MTCKGLRFRASAPNLHHDSRGFSLKARWRLVKSKSCPGCDECREIMDGVREKRLTVAWPESVVPGWLYLLNGQHGCLT